MEDLISYLKNAPGVPGEDIVHRKLVDRILNDGLAKRGIPDQKEVFSHKTLMEGQIPVGSIDIVVVTHSDELYIAEICATKVPEHNKVRYRLNDRLGRAYRFFKSNFGLFATQIGIYQTLSNGRIHHYISPRPIEDVLNNGTIPYAPDSTARNAP